MVLSAVQERDKANCERYRDRTIESIHKKTGRTFTIDVDWNAWAAAGEDFKLASYFWSYFLEALEVYMGRLCNTPEGKKAFVDATAASTIKFVPGKDGGYGKCKFSNGVLTVTCDPEMIGGNNGECGRNMEEALVQAGSSSGGVTAIPPARVLAVALNLDESLRELDVNKLKAVVSAPKFPVDVPVSKVYDRDRDNTQTALHHTVFLAIKDATVVLLEAGANPNVENVEGDTPLHLALDTSAVHYGSYVRQDNRLETIEALIKSSKGKLNPNIKNNKGANPLHLALSYGLWDCAEIMLTRCTNIDTDLKDGTGRTPIEIAIQGGAPRDILSLIEKCKKPAAAAKPLPAVGSSAKPLAGGAAKPVAGGVGAKPLAGGVVAKPPPPPPAAKNTTPLAGGVAAKPPPPPPAVKTAPAPSAGGSSKGTDPDVVELVTLMAEVLAFEIENRNYEDASKMRTMAYKLRKAYDLP